MFEKDYIMREVQKLVEALNVILGLKKEQKFDEALDEVENTYVRFFDENRATIQSANFEEIKELCSKEGSFSSDLGFALADIIKEEAEIIEAEGEKEKANKKYRLSLELYQSACAEKNAAVPLDILNKIERLEGKINQKK